MAKLAQTTIRSTELSIAYSPCYGIVLMCHNMGIAAIAITKLKSKCLSSHDTWLVRYGAGIYDLRGKANIQECELLNL